MTSRDVEAIRKLSRALCDAPRDPGSLSAAARRIADGHGHLLYTSLLDALRSQGTDEASTIQAAMSLFEAMMDVAPGVGGYLMARLQPAAGKHLLHAAFDAVELWMSNTASEELADNLTRLATEGLGPKRRRHVEAWADRMRDRCRRGSDGR